MIARCLPGLLLAVAAHAANAQTAGADGTPDPVGGASGATSIVPCPEGAEPRDCTRHGELADGGDAVFTFTTEAPGQWVQIDMQSAAFDTYLRLLGPLEPGQSPDDARQIASDDDSGQGSNSRLRRELPTAGRYAVLARSFASGKGGSYTLVVRNLPPQPPRSPTPLLLQSPVSGAFTGEEVEPIHWFTVTGDAGQVIVIDAQAAFDAVLEAGYELKASDASAAVASDFHRIAGNDDTCGLHPQLAIRFTGPDTVLVRLAAAGNVDAKGSYAIIARPQGPQQCVMIPPAQR